MGSPSNSRTRAIERREAVDTGSPRQRPHFIRRSNSSAAMFETGVSRQRVSV